MIDRAIEILPTYVPESADGLAEAAKRVRAYASEFHIDVDDGIFAPPVTWPYSEAGSFTRFDLSGVEGLVSEIHLMVQDPKAIGLAFAEAGAHRIVAHIEAFASAREAEEALQAWKENGAREVGLGLLMQTPFEKIAPLLPRLDVVHMMSIARIGTQGIPYEPMAPARIAEFSARFPGVLISVDGGVSENNIQDLVRAGARRFGVGSAISKAADPAAAYQRIKSVAEAAAA